MVVSPSSAVSSIAVRLSSPMKVSTRKIVSLPSEPAGASTAESSSSIDVDEQGTVDSAMRSLQALSDAKEINVRVDSMIAAWAVGGERPETAAQLESAKTRLNGLMDRHNAVGVKRDDTLRGLSTWFEHMSADSSVTDDVLDDDPVGLLEEAYDTMRMFDANPLSAALLERIQSALARLRKDLTRLSTSSPTMWVLACVTTVYLSFGPIGEKRMHALKGLACRKRVAAASSPAATCKQGAALTSLARHACGCARPSRARFSYR
jgi:hypothetical protein